MHCVLYLPLWVVALVGFSLAGGAAPGPEAAPRDSFPPVSGVEALRGSLRPLPDGRLELYYDWSDPAQLADWRVVGGEEPRVADGELQLAGRETHSLRHVASFVGPIEAAGTWRIHQALGDNGHCGIGLCAAPWSGYWLHLRDRLQDFYRLDSAPAFLASLRARFRDGTGHTFHFARSGSGLWAWLDRTTRLRAADAAYQQGAVLLRAWRVRAGFRGVWLLGRLDPQWLALNPKLAGQIQAIRLDATRLRGIAIPRPATATESAATAAMPAERTASPALAGEQPALPVTPGERVTFAGKPLSIEAEAATRVGAVQVERDETASGGRFVWEPRGEGDGQYGRPGSRVVLHVAVNQPCAAYLWARVRSPSANANSFFFAVAPEGAANPNLKPWHLAPRPGWHWEPYNVASITDQGSTKPSAIQLQPGGNAIIIAVRERATALDKLCLSETPDPPAE